MTIRRRRGGPNCTRSDWELDAEQHKSARIWVALEKEPHLEPLALMERFDLSEEAAWQRISRAARKRGDRIPRRPSIRGGGRSSTRGAGRALDFGGVWG